MIVAPKHRGLKISVRAVARALFEVLFPEK
jgi:hypothetical protein